jgi:hypothetical protein
MYLNRESGYDFYWWQLRTWDSGMDRAGVSPWRRRTMTAGEGALVGPLRAEVGLGDMSHGEPVDHGVAAEKEWTMCSYGDVPGAGTNGRGLLHRLEDVAPADDGSGHSPEHVSSQAARRLLIAILRDAIYCYQKYLFAGNRRHCRLFRDTEKWLTLPNRGAAVSFEYVCQALHIDPGYLRRGLRRWRRRQLPGTQLPARPQLPRREPAVGTRGRYGLPRRGHNRGRSGIGDELHGRRLDDHGAATEGEATE